MNAEHKVLADKLINAKQTRCSLPLLPPTGVAGEASLGRRGEQVEDEDEHRHVEGEAEDSHLDGGVYVVSVCRQKRNYQR